MSIGKSSHLIYPLLPVSLPFSLLFRSAIVLSFLAACVSAQKCQTDDESALLSFKSAVTADPSGLLSTWKLGTDCCSWSGVTCRDGNRVTTISLYGDRSTPGRFISATIPSSLSALTYLDGLYLVNLGNLTGELPLSLFRLPKLIFIYIENSALHGQIPADIGQKMPHLQAFSLAGNRFSGGIPASVSSLTELTQLNLGRNQFSGTVPAGIGRLKNLTLLALDQNRLSGAVPDLSQLSDLRVLQLSNNGFRGEIPAWISRLSPNLTYLELGNNRFSGRIPDFLGSFRSLDTLDLSGNRLTGTVPKTFRNLTKIFNLNLAGNDLVGPFPEMFVRGIESLDLSHNRFNLGEIPPWVTSSPIIFSLKLAGCGLKMNISAWTPKETYFYDFIDLSENQIYGSPAPLINRTGYLISFLGRGNRMKFDMAELSLLPKTMKSLDLSRNLVFGKIPKSISGLTELNVSYNHLCGPIPANKFPASAFIGNDCLCGAPLPSCHK